LFEQEKEKQRESLSDERMSCAKIRKKKIKLEKGKKPDVLKAAIEAPGDRGFEGQARGKSRGKTAPCKQLKKNVKGELYDREEIFYWARA